MLSCGEVDGHQLVVQIFFVERSQDPLSTDRGRNTMNNDRHRAENNCSNGVSRNTKQTWCALLYLAKAECFSYDNDESMSRSHYGEESGSAVL